jgi:leucyl aminopeptidase (aminopeptidase T)
MPGITEEIVATTLDADYSEVERIGVLLAGRLTSCNFVHITSRNGTDLILRCDGRQGIADTGRLTAAGAFGNLPAGEAMVAPVETEGDGVLVVDGVISEFAVMEEPLTLTFSQGRISQVEGRDARAFEDFIAQFSDTAGRVCEFGIGTNAACSICGNSLVDEKVFGTIHIACGNNLFMGGQQGGDMHYDMIIRTPTVELDGVRILEGGRHIY